MKISTLKTLLVLIFFIAAMIFPIGEAQTIRVTMITIPFVFIVGVLFAPLFLYNSLHNKLTILKPHWSDKIDSQKPLTYIHFLAIVFIFWGIGGLIRGSMREQLFNYIGIFFVALGFGMLMGIHLISKKAH